MEKNISKARKTSSKASSRAKKVIIAETIENVVIDHSSQLESWTPAASEVEEILAAVEIEEVSNAAYDELGPILVEQPTDELLEQLSAEAEVYEEQAVQSEQASELMQPTESFSDLIATFDDETVTAKAHAISAAIDDRVEHESEHGNPNILSTLKKVRSAFVSKAAARVMLATNTAESFINRSVHEGKRYNVYALGKAADIMKAATDGVLSNAINNACMRSLFAMRTAGLPFTLETAKACASKNYSCDAAIRTHLIRHTVSTSTAPTQASSTMQALTTLGVVRSTGSSKNPTFVLTDHPIVAKLDEVLRAA